MNRVRIRKEASLDGENGRPMSPGIEMRKTEEGQIWGKN